MKGGAKSNKTIEQPKPNYKGMLGICPVLIADPFGECVITERHWSAIPLLHVVVWFYMAYFWMLGLIFPGISPSWPVRITGKVGE